MSSKNTKFFGKKLVAPLPKTAQATIPFIEAYENGLFLVAENTYSLIFSFENIDYTLIRDEEREKHYHNYMRLLNSLPTDVHYQELILNTEIDEETLRKNMLPKGDNSALAQDYRHIMQNIIEQSIDSVSDKLLICVLSYKPQTKLDTPNVLFKYYRELTNYFSAIGSSTKQLFPMDVFKLLHKYYHQFDEVPFALPQNVYSKGGSIKDYIAPAIFNFQPKQIVIGNSLTRIMFVKTFDRELTDEFIDDLLDNNYKIAVSKQLERLPKSVAMENIRKKIFSVQENVQKRKEKNYKSGQDFVPFRYTEQLRELEDLQNQLSDSACELFNIGVYISISAKTPEQLEELTQFVRQKGMRHQVNIDVLTHQQEKGLNTVLPFGINYLAGKNNNTCTTLLSDAASILVPFTCVNHFADGGIFYGISKKTNSPLVLDRTSEMNANGWVLGTSGSGKSMFTKAELFEIYLKYIVPTGDEVIIIDPENEYKPLVAPFGGEIVTIAPDSNTNINLFDTKLEYSEDGVSAISTKSEFIMTIIETAKGQPLTAQEKSIINRCVKLVYMDFEKSGGNTEKLPTLIDFYNLLKKQSEQEAKDIATAIEIYVTGSFDIFAHRTNVKTEKKFLVFDIFNMGDQLRTVALQVVLEYLWQRVIENKHKGIRTWVVTDEFSIMFSDGAGRETHKSGDFFAKVYKRIRKHGGVATGITQNISEVLDSPQATTMIQNSEFVVLLQQKKSDLEKLVEMFNLSPSQTQYLQTGEKGAGLIVCGKRVIPFSKPIPKDSLMYRICSTNFSEMQQQLKGEM